MGGTGRGRAGRMKAWVSAVAGGPETLELRDLPVPQAGPGQLRVRVAAVGINFPDGLLLRDQYQVQAPRPLVPGSEFCGVVEALGEGVDGFVSGDTVVARCGWGAMAEQVVVDAVRCTRLPAGLPRLQAAGFLFAYATAYHALHDAAGLRAGETLLVLGAAGGVGSAAVELGRAAGATVLAAASTPAKRDFAVGLGASQGLVYDGRLQPGDGQKALAAQFKALAPQGVDVVLDPIGGAYTEPALRSLARGGRHLVVGFTAGIPRVPLNLTLLKSSRIVGVDWRTFVQHEPQAQAANVQALLALWQQGRIRPQVTETYALHDAPHAIARLASRDVLGKIVVDMTR